MNVTFFSVCFLSVFILGTLYFSIFHLLALSSLIFILLLIASSDIFSFGLFQFSVLKLPFVFFLNIFSISFWDILKILLQECLYLFIGTLLWGVISCFCWIISASPDLSLGTWSQHSGEFSVLLFCLTHPWLSAGEASSLETSVNIGKKPKKKNKTKKAKLRKAPLLCFFWPKCQSLHAFVLFTYNAHLFFFFAVLLRKSRLIHSVLELEEKRCVNVNPWHVGNVNHVPS